MYSMPRIPVPGKASHPPGGRVPGGVDQFDADFTGIAPLSVNMDTGGALLLEIGWEALENADPAPAALNRRRHRCLSGYLQQRLWQVVIVRDEPDRRLRQ